MAAKQSIQTRVRTHLKLAKCWLTTAAADVRRLDRLDALDAIEFATRALHKARAELRATLPKVPRQ
jgi:hypothetical protein